MPENKPELALQGWGPNKRELKKFTHDPLESQPGDLRRLRAGMGTAFTQQKAVAPSFPQPGLRPRGLGPKEQEGERKALLAAYFKSPQSGTSGCLVGLFAVLCAMAPLVVQ